MAKIKLGPKTPGLYFLIYLVAAVVVLIAVFPFVWMLSTSFKLPQDTFTAVPKLIPPHFVWDNYLKVLQETLLSRYFFNSLYIALLVTLLSIWLAAMGAYALSRFRFPGRRAIALSILGVQMFPSVVLIIPLFIVMRKLQLLNNHLSLIISYTTFTLPLCIWVLKGFFDTIPRELEEAALIDGCSEGTAFFRVILPLTLPGIAATGIYAFIGAWNEFVFAMTFINQDELNTMPVGLTTFFGQFTVEWNQLMAASVLFTIPSLLFFVVARKYLASGMISGAVKG
jgi:arabinogalactan oligomer/maltooligosaccharide transport system permease protein